MVVYIYSRIYYTTEPPFLYSQIDFAFARNALRPDAHNKWIHYTDRLGRYVIPYEINGTFSEFCNSVTDYIRK